MAWFWFGLDDDFPPQDPQEVPHLEKPPRPLRAAGGGWHFAARVCHTSEEVTGGEINGILNFSSSI